ncbi:hypothetical protein Tco_1443823, partial [Tanacetum coccineum]
VSRVASSSLSMLSCGPVVFAVLGLVSSISIGGNISSEGFLSSIQLSMVIIVTVVIIVVILIVVVDDVSLILKLLFAIVDSFSCYWSFACPDVLPLVVGWHLESWLVLLMLMFSWEAFYKRTCSKNDITSLERGYGMIHEDGDNDAIGGNDDEREIKDGEWIRFLGGNSSSGTKKYRGSNSSDIGDGVKIAGEVIGSGDEIEFSKELKELLPDEGGK